MEAIKLALARQTAHGYHTRSSNWFGLLGGNTCVLEGLSICHLGGGRVGENACGTKYLCGNGVNSFLRCISYETQVPQAPLEENRYGMYHIFLSEASCEG